MSEKSSTVTIGPGFTGLLTLVFVVAKIMGKVDWPWLWVFCPLWIPALLFAAFALFALCAWATLKLLGSK